MPKRASILLSESRSPCQDKPTPGLNEELDRREHQHQSQKPLQRYGEQPEGADIGAHSPSGKNRDGQDPEESPVGGALEDMRRQPAERVEQNKAGRDRRGLFSVRPTHKKQQRT